MSQYFKLLSKKAFRLRFEGTDLLSTIFLAALGAADYYRPQWGIDMDAISWQTPLIFLGIAFALRIISAPYFIWKEENHKSRSLEEKYADPRSVERILIKKSYSTAEKHALNDMFAELKTLLGVEIRQVELGCQTLVPQIWKTTYINSLEQLIREHRAKVDEMNTKLDEIGKKFSAFNQVFQGIVGTEIPNELVSMRNQFDQCIEPVLSAQRLHAVVLSDTNRVSDLSKLLALISERVRDQTAKVNGWLVQTLQKIDAVEAELEKR